MKATVVFFALIFGYIAPTYSQLNRHRKTDAAASEQFQNKKHYDFGNFKVDKFGGFLSEGARDRFSFESFKFDKSTGFLSDRAHDGFNMFPTTPAPSGQISAGGKMPCFHPKSGDKMPCFKPTDTFPMRVFTPNDVIWGILF